MAAKQCLIIGAGMSGLMAAQTLQRAGWQVTILDKGRGVGGRMATRRIEGAIFDHGAQFFTVRDPRFAQYVDTWRAAGVVEQWARGFPKPDAMTYADGYPRYCGVSGMTAIAKYLSANLDVRIGVRVQEIAIQGGEQWQVTTVTGEQYKAPYLLLSMPVPQAVALLDTGAVPLPTAQRTLLASIDYDPCFAVLATLEGPSHIPPPGAVQIDSDPIRWIADNTQKGVSPNRHAVTIHGSASFSRDYFEADTAVVAQKLLAAAQDWLGSAVINYQVQRWRYSQPVSVYSEPYLSLDMQPFVAFTGDAFGASRVEGAALSGLAAADALLAQA